MAVSPRRSKHTSTLIPTRTAVGTWSRSSKFDMSLGPSLSRTRAIAYGPTSSYPAAATCEMTNDSTIPSPDAGSHPISEEEHLGQRGRG